MIKLIGSTLFLLPEPDIEESNIEMTSQVMNALQTVNPCWERISIILREQQLSAAAFSKVLGLPDPRALYRIKNRNGRITPRLAAIIHRTFPDYDAEWLQNGRVTFTVDIPSGFGKQSAVTYSRRISKSLCCNAAIWNSPK